MNADFALENVKKFIREHNHELLGRWTFASVAEVSRLFAVVVANSSDEIERYAEIAAKSYGKFAWGRSVGEEGLPKFRIQQSDLPAVMVVDIVGARYFRLLNAGNLSAVEEWIGRFDGDIEEIPYESMRAQKTEAKALHLREMRIREAIKIIKVTLMISIPICSAIGYAVLKYVDREMDKKRKLAKKQE
jgi:hypothetical protein